MLSLRLKVSRSKNAASLYVTKTVYDNNKKEKTVTVEKLGTEKELRKKLGGQDPYEWARAYIDELNRLEKEQGDKKDVVAKFSPTRQIPKGAQYTFNVGYLFLQQIYYDLRLDTICSAVSKNYKFEYDLNAILSRLIYTRILFPASKHRTLGLSSKFIEQPTFELHHIYRALTVISKESDYIQSQLYKNSLAVSKRNARVLFYDCTNFFFEAEQAEGFKQYGKGKENRPNPIVEMGLFMDGDGFPLAFGIHPGNTNEQVTLRPLEKKILSDFELSKFVVCTDAGLASAANRRFNDRNGRAFITTQSIKKLKLTLKNWALSPDGWRLDRDKKDDATPSDATYSLTGLLELYHSEEISDKDKKMLGSQVFFKERWINEGNLEQRLIVTFSLKYKNYQSQIRQAQIDRAQKLIDNNPTKMKKCNSNDYKRFIKKEHCTPDGEAAENEFLSIDQTVIDEEAKYDGFYAVCTNLEDPVSGIVKVNKGRWEIEESFRIIKSEFKARPAHVSRDDRIQAHFMTCFISLMIYRLLEKKLDEQFTCDNILTELRGMNVYELNGEGYVPAYTRTDFTDALHDKYGFHTDYQIVKKKELKKIIRSTKSKKGTQFS